MVGAQRATAGCINLQGNKIANLDLARSNRHLMRMQTSKRLCRIGNFAAHVRARNNARVTHLAAAFAVKWRLVGDDGHGVVCDSRLHFHAIVDEGNDLPLAFIRCVPGKLGRTNAFGDVEPYVVRCLGAGTLPRGTCHGLLIVHGGFETGLINTKALRTQRIFGQVIWKAICVIKLKRGIAGKYIAGLHTCGGFVQQLDALVQRTAELGFFLLQRRFDHRLRA